DVVCGQAATEDQRHLGTARLHELPVEGLSGAPAQGPLARILGARVEQVKVDVKALEVANVSGDRDLRRADHARAGAPCGLGAVGGALIATELEQRQA